MLYAFELSGEHEELPAAEVFACLKIEGLDFRPHTRIDQCLVVDIAGKEEDVERTLTRPDNRKAGNDPPYPQSCRDYRKYPGLGPETCRGI